MDKEELIKRVSDKANVTYDNAQKALENSQWDMLDAMLYLERHGFIEKPDVDVFYSNKQNSYKNSASLINLNKDDDENKENNNWKSKKSYNRIFEIICEKIDIGNNFFIEIKKDTEVFLKVPLTVVVILLFFASWIVLPVIAILLILGIEFFVTAKRVDQEKIDKINNNLNEVSKNIERVKERLKKEFRK